MHKAYHDIAAGLLQEQPGTQQLHLDALGVGAGHVALGERQDDGAARLLRMLQRLSRLRRPAHMLSAQLDTVGRPTDVLVPPLSVVTLLTAAAVNPVHMDCSRTQLTPALLRQVSGSSMGETAHITRHWLLNSGGVLGMGEMVTCGMTPSLAATTRMTMSVTCAPRARMAENAACPGVSRKVAVPYMHATGPTVVS